MKRKIPKFRTEEEERDFWNSADSTDYLDWKEAKKINFPKLQPRVKTISPNPKKP